MSTKILVDSIARDREEFPNPCEFSLPGRKVQGWFDYMKTTRGTPGSKITEFVTTVALELIHLPYVAALLDLRYIQVEFRSRTFDDAFLIASAHSGGDPRTRFILQIDKVINGSAGAPTWIVYKPSGPMVMRIKRSDDLIFTLKDPTGTVITGIVDTAIPGQPDPLKQVTAVFDCLPYIEDARYSHLEELS